MLAKNTQKIQSGDTDTVSFDLLREFHGKFADWFACVFESRIESAAAILKYVVHI